MPNLVNGLDDLDHEGPPTHWLPRCFPECPSWDQVAATVETGYCRVTWSFLCKDQSPPHKEEKAPNKVVFSASGYFYFWPIVSNFLTSFYPETLGNRDFQKCLSGATLHPSSLLFHAKIALVCMNRPSFGTT